MAVSRSCGACCAVAATAVALTSRAEADVFMTSRMPAFRELDNYLAEVIGRLHARKASARTGKVERLLNTA